MSKPWAIRQSTKRKADGEQAVDADGCLYQLPMRGHTSYLTLALRPLDDELSAPAAVALRDDALATKERSE